MDEFRKGSLVMSMSKMERGSGERVLEQKGSGPGASLKNKLFVLVCVLNICTGIAIDG